MTKQVLKWTVCAPGSYICLLFLAGLTTDSAMMLQPQYSPAYILSPAGGFEGGVAFPLLINSLAVAALAAISTFIQSPRWRVVTICLSFLLLGRVGQVLDNNRHPHKGGIRWQAKAQ